MKLSRQIRPISYLKAHAAEIVRTLAEQHAPMVITQNGEAKADYVLERVEKALSKLAQFPERGVYPKELLVLGIRDYREVFFKPYRIIHRVLDPNVYVLLIVDGRRDLQPLLQRRLLDA
jgi:toxin ParE1/3/4